MLHRITLAGLLALPVLLGSATPPPTTPDRAAPPVLQPPDRDLDDRIDGSKITEVDPPPLPEEIFLPLPPTFTLAENAEALGLDEETWTKARQAIDRGLDFLRRTQDDNGAWLGDMQAIPTDEPDKPSPIAVAITAMAVKAFVQGGVDPAQDDAIIRALQLIVNQQEEDGSFSGGALTNYVTSAAVSALASIETLPLRDQMNAAVEWLTSNQWDQSEGLNPRQDWFGGAGYGNQGRPDMSNTQMMLDALYDAGLSPDEPAFQKALVFISRAQNLQQTNSAEWAGSDGGFIYTPANGGESFASEMAGEGRYGENIPAGQARSLRSYGSMTYAGFKSMLYAGLSPDDLRVRAAFDWVRNNWTFEENPGLGQQGLYYYYHTMARALRVAQQNTITDAEGNKHHWRTEMIEAIVARQTDDGGWINEADRWLEGQAVMATVYAVLSLQELLK